MAAVHLARDCAGSGGIAPGFAAVALALVLVAAEARFEEGSAVTGSDPASRWGLARAIEDARAQVALDLQRAWWGPEVGSELPLVRARQAAERALTNLNASFPMEAGLVHIGLGAVTVSIQQVPDDRIAGDFALHVSGTLVAASASEGSVGSPVESIAVDPAHGEATSHLEELAGRLLDDPQSVIAASVRARVLRLLLRDDDPSPTVLASAVRSALADAANAIDAELRGTEGPPDPGASDEGGDDQVQPAADLHALILHASPAELGDCFDNWAQARPFDLARSVLMAAAKKGGALREAALAWVNHDSAGVRAALSALPGVNATLADWAAGDLAAFLADLAAGMVEATQRAGNSLRRFLPLPPANGSPPASPLASLQGRNATLTWLRADAPVVGPRGVLRPFEALARLHVDLEVSFAMNLADGTRLARSYGSPATFDIPVAAARPPARLAAAARNASTLFLFGSVGELAGLFEGVGLLQEARREVDRRLFTFRDRVTHKIEESSASAFSRLLFRILDGIAEGNRSSAHQALFDFLERYFADELRDALTVNFTLLGVNFTLVPDPIRQQVSLEHREGPHTFGVRVRRVSNESDPLEPKWRDHASLALELYWKYDRYPVDARLTIDPFLRTDEGLLRFRLRTFEGEGLEVSVVAPRVLRREGVFEFGLSNWIPGGVPVGLTPTGAKLTLDFGVRVEVASVRLPTLARWVLRAVEDAWFDTVANRTIAELAKEVGTQETSLLLLGHLLNRLADTAAAQASRSLPRLDAFVRLAATEPGGQIAGRAELALSVHEPVIVFREIASNWAQGVAEAFASASAGRAPPAGALDWLPTAVHERVGLAIRVSLHAGLDTFFIAGRTPKPLPDADMTLGLFLSAGALSTFVGRSGVHTVSEVTLTWEGLAPAARKALRWWRLGPDDALDIVWMRLESLAGPPMLISEVMPSPAGNDTELEFIEVYNPGYAEETLSGWALRDGGGRVWRFPEGTRIAPGGFLLVARSSNEFLRTFGVAPRVPTLTLALNDAGDRIQLVNPRAMVSDEVAWGEGARATKAPGEGRALARPLALHAPLALPGCALQFTGSELDFVEATATPGTAPG